MAGAEKSVDWEHLARSLHASFLLRWHRHDQDALERTAVVEGKRQQVATTEEETTSTSAA